MASDGQMREWEYALQQASIQKSAKEHDKQRRKQLQIEEQMAIGLGLAGESDEPWPATSQAKSVKAQKKPSTKTSQKSSQKTNQKKQRLARAFPPATCQSAYTQHVVRQVSRTHAWFFAFSEQSTAMQQVSAARSDQIGQLQTPTGKPEV